MFNMEKKGFRNNSLNSIGRSDRHYPVCLGLGHANFDNSLMSTRVHSGSGTISSCESQAIYEANHWKLNQKEDGTNYHIYQPNSKFIECKSVI